MNNYTHQTAVRSENERNKAVVAEYFQAGVQGHITSVAAYLHLDFGRFTYDVFIAADERVVALVNFGIIGSDAAIKISEHWTVRDGRATSIWVAYFEPQACSTS